MSEQKVRDLLARNKEFQAALSPSSFVDIPRASRNDSVPQGLVILSCSDPRVIPEEYFNLKRGEAAVIRNAGGRASDALRSILMLDAIVGIATIIVVHHTDCGTTRVHDEEVREMLKKRVPVVVQSSELNIDEMKFGEILDINESIRDDVTFLKTSPFLRKDTRVLGYSLDIHTGQLMAVN